MNRPTDKQSPGLMNDELLKHLVNNEKMAELGRISTGIAHELNAPLSVIASAAQLILRENDVPEFIREMVERINAESIRLSQMTRGLLAFGRQDEGVEEMDVNLAVEFILDFLSYEAARRGISVLRNLDYHLQVVRMDSNMFKQILLNLVMNSLQAMEEGGGKLLVETSSPRDGEISVVIADTGQGIPEEARAKIFEPYFTTKKPGKGTGLGLFITKTLVESMGGRIDVKSRRNKGTSFSVTFTVAEETG
jgi:signal transduction histidine kinase